MLAKETRNKLCDITSSCYDYCRPIKCRRAPIGRRASLGSRETDINANVIIASYEGGEKRRRGGNEKHGEPREWVQWKRVLLLFPRGVTWIRLRCDRCGQSITLLVLLAARCIIASVTCERIANEHAELRIARRVRTRQKIIRDTHTLRSLLSYSRLVPPSRYLRSNNNRDGSLESAWFFFSWSIREIIRRKTNSKFIAAKFCLANKFGKFSQVIPRVVILNLNEIIYRTRVTLVLNASVTRQKSLTEEC